jgi:hypothetical protein
MDDTLLKIFIFVDDFYKNFEQHWNNLLLDFKNENSRNRKPELYLSELMTILLCFHLGDFKSFKSYYKFLIKYHKSEFPNLVSYTRIVELKSSCAIPLLVLFEVISASCDGESYIDSTHLPICHIKREYIHKTFKGMARKSKSTMGWYIGFKLHMIVNKFGHPISFSLTHANCDDRKAPDNLFSKIFGKLFADRGYIGKPFFDRMKDKMIHIVTALRSNMKPQIMVQEDSKKLNKRGIIESAFNSLKNNLNMQHTRHRSPQNFAINLISSVCAFCLRFITSLSLSKNNMLMIP